MRITLSFAIVAGLAACGGGETTTSTGTPPGGGQQVGSALGALGQTSTAQSGFATAGSDMDNVPNGESFTMPVYVQREQTPDFWSSSETEMTIAYVDGNTIDLTVDGRTFRLTKSGAVTGATSYRGGSGPAVATLRLIDIPQGSAKIAFSQIDNFDINAVILQRELAWGGLGYATDPATLAGIAKADYGGFSFFDVFESGIVQTAFRPLDITADFANGSITGTTDYISLASGTATNVPLSLSGTISGNACEAVADFDPAEVGISQMEEAVVKGRFFGDDAFTLAGVANGTGRAGNVTIDNLAYYFEIIANRK